MIKSDKISSVIFLTILDEETLPLLHLFNLIHFPFPSPFLTVFHGFYHNSIKIHLIQPKKDPKFDKNAIGPEISALMAYIAIEKFKPDLFMNIGSAGGVIRDNFNKKNLKIGDICITNQEIFFYDRLCEENSKNLENLKKIVEFKGYLQGKYEVFFMKEFTEKLGIKEVSIGTSASFSGDQRNAFEAGVDVVDMEAASIAKVCYWMNVRFMALKGISDLDDVGDEEQKEMFESNLKEVSKKLALKVKEILAVLCEF